MTSDPSHLTLCPTPRLVVALRADFARQQSAPHWRTPSIMTLEAWLDDTLEAILLTQPLPATVPCKLPAEAEAELWTAVIRDELDADAVLLDVQTLVQAAIEANRYTIAWHLPLAQFGDIETRQFRRWQVSFQQHCQRLKMLEAARYREWQLELLTQSTWCTPSTISLVGFEHDDAQEQHLKTLLQARGIAVQEISAQPLGVCRQLALDNRDAECRAAVAWVCAQRTAHPQARLALVCTDYHQQRLLDLLADNLPTEHLNVSLGSPLAQQQMVASALLVLECAVESQFDSERLSCLLTTLYWSQADASQRALLDARLRECLPPSFTRKQLRAALQKNAPERIKQEFNALWQNPLPAQRPSAWAKTWAHVLAVWPGTRSLDSYEVQVQKAWQKALETLAALDVLERDYSAAGALAVTRRICQNQLFQVQSSPDAALQILGLREPLSAPVDALWVLGMNDDILPPAPRPNPLLPYALQRQFALPNADSKVQAQLAARIFARLQVSAKQVIFSYSKMDDTRELLPSPLLANLPCLSEPPAPALTQAEILAQQPKPSLQALLDTQAPTIATGVAVAGGVGALQAQAVCPAWAFYRYRLAARPLHQPELGIDALTRGNLVHQVLADFWRQRSFANLTELSPSALQTTVQALAQAAVHRCSHHRPYPQRLLELEVVALTERICAWLDFESTQPFRAVLSVEEKRQALLADIEFSFKPDRIHVLEDGSHVVVDYKTGSLPSLASWAEPRLLEPQLPFYALFAAPDLEGAYFARVRVGENAFDGVSTADWKQRHKALQGFANWQALTAHWRQCLTVLAQELQQGEAAVRVYDEAALRYCEVLPLLRLAERQLQLEQEEVA